MERTVWLITFRFSLLINLCHRTFDRNVGTTKICMNDVWFNTKLTANFVWSQLKAIAFGTPSNGIDRIGTLSIAFRSAILDNWKTAKHNIFLSFLSPLLLTKINFIKKYRVTLAWGNPKLSIHNCWRPQVNANFDLYFGQHLLIEILFVV